MHANRFPIACISAVPYEIAVSFAVQQIIKSLECYRGRTQIAIFTLKKSMSSQRTPPPEKSPNWKSIKVNQNVDYPAASKQSMSTLPPGMMMTSTYAPSNSPNQPPSKFTFQNVSNPNMMRTNPTPPPLMTAGTAALSPSVTHLARKMDMSQPKINVVTDPRKIPIATVISEAQSLRDFSQPAHRYNIPTPSNIAIQAPRKVDSRAEAKQPAPNLTFNSKQMIQNTETILSPSGVPKFIGSSFQNLPHHQVPRPAVSLPTKASIPRPYQALATEQYSHVGTLLNNRTAQGKILGQAGHRYIQEHHIPAYVPPSEMSVQDIIVNEENPYEVVGETNWYKCWDDEAGAVYYYNSITGEATWIVPDSLLAPVR